MYPQLMADVMDRLDQSSTTVTHDKTTDLLLINGEYSAWMVLSRCRQTPAGSLRWLISIDSHIAPDITILVRMDPSNQHAADYYLFPIMDISGPRLLLCETNGAHLDTCRLIWQTRPESQSELRLRVPRKIFSVR